MNIQKEQIINIGYKYLIKNGIFINTNYIDNQDLCILDKITNSVEKYINEIDRNITKEYPNFYISNKETFENSVELNKRKKTTFNFRGLAKDKKFDKKKTYTYDIGFCDIYRAELLFNEIKNINFKEIYSLCKKIKPDFNKDKDIMYNIYYTHSVVNTRSWHRDGNIIKFFIYLEDVEIENGPYSYIINSSKILLDKNKEISNEKLDLVLKTNSIYQKYIFNGKKGTLICSNQNGVHRGQPQKNNKKRIILVLKLINL